jgi:hypothetical protein
MAMATAMQRQWQHNHAGHCTQWQWQFSAMKTQYPAIACGRFWLSRNPMAPLLVTVLPPEECDLAVTQIPFLCLRVQVSKKCLTIFLFGYPTVAMTFVFPPGETPHKTQHARHPVTG